MPLIETLLRFKEALRFNVNAQAGDKLYAAIHYAAKNGNEELCELLCAHGADLTLKNAEGVRAGEMLHQAVSARLISSLRPPSHG